MTKFFHWLTTSRYTLYLERENADLKARCARLESVLIPRLAVLQAQSENATRQAAKPQEAAKPAQPRVKFCANCDTPHTEHKCPQCGSVETVTPAALSPRRKFVSFARIKQNLDSETSHRGKTQ